ncbi:stage II sporulation protein P [Thermosediminibacter litoriperuensis]|uniref:Stage II sporulation protein P n=1 Tax=Thermosediminibacter litoriperuensis TaxID=291989 RepID=A0A5S5AGL0_9FIRM|nr:stage II sporulation protein P [Thermosediminibacter litoriperuensis]
MIDFRIIRIKKTILYAVAVILLFALGVVSVKTVVKESAPVFGEFKDPARLKIVGDLDSRVFRAFFLWAVPAAKAYTPENVVFFNPGESFLKFQERIAIFDFFKPKGYLGFQIPLLNLVNIEPALTPGIESPEQGVVENEHVPSNNPPPAPPEDEDSDVEQVTPVAGKPLVLVYHTHTTESYMPSKEYDYKPRDQAFHADDLKFTVARVGEVLTSELNRQGIPTIHNKTVHDVPTYMYSYSNSLKTVEEVLKKNPSIQIVLDIHRDAPVPDPQRAREMTTVKIDNKYYSRIMFVVGTDKIFPHPHWRENYKFALVLQNKLEELYPGITREIDLREQRFNQHVSKKALLVEIGSHGNTMEESIESARAFARSLAEVIKDLSEPGRE